jgi:ketosteroid isomerase-like protein
MLMLAGCARRIDTQQESAKLLATDVEFSKKSVEAGAPEAFNNFLAEDALQLNAQSDPVNGRENIYRRMKSGGGGYILRWEPQKAEVSLSGDLGYTWGNFTLTSGVGNDQSIVHGKYVNVWRKQPGGLWKVIVDIGNQKSPPVIPTANN